MQLRFPSTAEVVEAPTYFTMSVPVKISGVGLDKFFETPDTERSFFNFARTYYSPHLSCRSFSNRYNVLKIMGEVESGDKFPFRKIGRKNLV